MLTAPTQNWKLYEDRCREANASWLRALSVAEAFALYESLYRFAHSFPSDPADLERLAVRRWQEKIAIRRKLVSAFAKLDAIRHGRCHPDDSH